MESVQLSVSNVFLLQKWYITDYWLHLEEKLDHQITVNNWMVHTKHRTHPISPTTARSAPRGSAHPPLPSAPGRSVAPTVWGVSSSVSLGRRERTSRYRTLRPGEVSEGQEDGKQMEVVWKVHQGRTQVRMGCFRVVFRNFDLAKEGLLLFFSLAMFAWGSVIRTAWNNEFASQAALFRPP